MDTLPANLAALQRQLEIAPSICGDGAFFGGPVPSHGDFNVYHHLSNIMMVDPAALIEYGPLREWMVAIETLPSMATYLDSRPELVGIGVDPGLRDKNGILITQQHPAGRALLVGGEFVFE